MITSNQVPLQNTYTVVLLVFAINLLLKLLYCLNNKFII